jgi:hypothetical protein
VALPSAVVQLVEQMMHFESQGRPSAQQAQGALQDILHSYDVADPRRVLRDWGTGEYRAENTEEDDALAPAVHLTPPRGRLAHLAARAPALLGMIALAVLLGLGAAGLRRILPGAKDGRTITPVAVQLDAGGTPPAGEEVMVLLVLPPEAILRVDGREIGTFSGRLHLALRPGRHRVEVEQTGGVQAKDVMLVFGTEPRFDFRPAGPPP